MIGLRLNYSCPSDSGEVLLGYPRQTELSQILISHLMEAVSVTGSVCLSVLHMPAYSCDSLVVGWLVGSVIQ